MDEFKETTEEHDKRIQRAVEIEKKSHTYFAHNTKAMDPTRLVESLNEAKKVIGDIYDTRDFVIGELRHAGINVKADNLPLCYSFQLVELEENIKPYFYGHQTRKGWYAFRLHHLLLRTICILVVIMFLWKTSHEQ